MKKIGKNLLNSNSFKILNRKELNQIYGGQVPDYCYNNDPGYVEECRTIALAEFMNGECPTWNPCFSSQPTGCIDMCMSNPGGH